MVVHEPGPWFAEVLDSLAGQDYTNLRFLFLVTGETGELPSMISERVPSAFVRAVNGNPGFGATALFRVTQGGIEWSIHDRRTGAPAYRGKTA